MLAIVVIDGRYHLIQMSTRAAIEFYRPASEFVPSKIDLCPYCYGGALLPPTLSEFAKARIFYCDYVA
jgi:hypothetical protein